MVFIECAKEDDILRILEIEVEAISPPWSHGALLSEIYNDDSFFATASCGAGISGFVILRRMARDGELLQIAVDRAARRLGVADALLGAALGFSRECALLSVFLEVRISNAAAIALYKKHGFKPVRKRKDYYSDPVEDALVMSMDL